MRTIIALLAGLALSLGLLSFNPVVAQQQLAPLPDAAGPETLSVMTYNVAGLPFPLAWGRDRAADRIAERLAALRAVGEQPDVVVLQEAFGPAQRAIGAKAGYRYVAYGPDATPVAVKLGSARDRAFAAAARMWNGERLGKWADSGLVILSDHPIRAVRRAAFPEHACGGLDCFANKGVMMALVDVPGADRPVAIVTTHLNSKNASRVSKARWNGAYALQVGALGRFLRANLPADVPFVLAGDLNVGKSPERGAWIEAMMADVRGRAPGLALRTCLGRDGGCALIEADDVRFSANHNKDWQFYGDGARIGLTPTAIAAPFGHDASGRMLSDHVGYTAFYRLAAVARPAMPAQLALR